jgi:hypothetical protein
VIDADKALEIARPRAMSNEWHFQNRSRFCSGAARSVNTSTLRQTLGTRNQG